MKRYNRLALFLLAATVAVMFGCGGGGAGNSLTTGTLGLSADGEMSLKGRIKAVATYSIPSAGNVQGIEINFSTNHPEWFGSQIVKVGSDGTATCVLAFSKPSDPARAPKGPTMVTLTATVGDLVQSTSFMLKPAQMTVTPPASASFSGGGTGTGGVVRVVPGGTFATISDGDNNPLVGVPVKVKVNAIVNGSPGDVLIWNNFPGGTVSAPPGTFTSYSDNLGMVPMQVTIDVVVPSVSHVVNVVWSVSFTDPDGGGVIQQYASSLLTASP